MTLDQVDGADAEIAQFKRHLLQAYANALEKSARLDPAFKRACLDSIALAEINRKLAILELKLRRWSEPGDDPVPLQVLDRLRRETLALQHRAGKLERQIAGQQLGQHSASRTD